MAETKKYEFNSFLIKSAMPTSQGFKVAGSNKEQEDIVYHYTSPDAFLSIIQNQTIRFTDIRYLNDRAEGIYFVKLLLDFVGKNSGKYPYFEEAINQLLKGNDWARIQNLETTEVHFNEIPRMPYKAERVFVFCACAEPDLLNMWNYYVNNGAYQGYNIGLRVKELLKTFDTPDQNIIDAFHVYYGNVLYDEKRQMSEIRMLAESIERGIEATPDKKRAIKYAQLNLRGYINAQGAFYKHPKFKAENEFRIIIEISDKGKGIENIEIAKEPLYTTKPNLERSGMGFTIMESFMDKMEVESIVGLGTKITMSKIIKPKQEDDSDEFEMLTTT